MHVQDNQFDQVVHLFFQVFQVFSSVIWTYGLLKYFQDPHEKVSIILTLQTVSIAVALNYVLLLPFDIFVTVRHTDMRLFNWTDPLTHHNWLPRMYGLYFISYVLLLVLGFIFVPFQMFYVQSVQEEDDLILETQIVSQNCAAGTKDGSNGSKGSFDEEGQQRNTEASSHQQPQSISTHSSSGESEASFSSKLSLASRVMKDFFNDGPKEEDVRTIFTRTSIQKFKYHGVRASKRTFVSVIVLFILLLLSYWASTYEYQNAHLQYKKLHDEISKKIGHHIEKGNSTKMVSNNRKNNSTKQGNQTAQVDDDIESEEDFNQEKSQMFMNMLFFGFGRNSSFNMTHFMDQSRKRANAIVQSMDFKKFNNWKHQLMDNLQEGEGSLRIVLTTIIVIGSFLNVIYLSYGLASLPHLLMKGTDPLEPSGFGDEVQGNMQQVRDQLQIIQEKYNQKPRSTISALDKANYKKCKRMERAMTMQENSKRNVQQEQAKLWRQISSFLQFVNDKRVEIGQGCLAVSCLLVGSMFITNLDRLLHSECGFQCGYLLETPSFFNPLDYLLRRLSSKHNYIINMEMFLDIMLFIAITTYCVICIFFSVVKIGINFFSFGEEMKVRRRQSLPQALSIVSLLVIVMLFAYSMQVMTIAPQYMMFGDQRVDKKDMERCTLKNGRSKHDTQQEGDKEQGDWGLNYEPGFGCQMTMISQLYNKMELGLPFFAIIIYFLHWAFIVAFVLCLNYHEIYKNAAHNLQQQQQQKIGGGAGYEQLSLTEDGDDSAEDEDLNNFLKSKPNSESQKGETPTAAATTVESTGHQEVQQYNDQQQQYQYDSAQQHYQGDNSQQQYWYSDQNNQNNFHY